MIITEEMRKTYEIVKHEYLLEDAHYQTETFLEWNEDYKSYEEIKDKVDYEELVRLIQIILYVDTTGCLQYNLLVNKKQKEREINK